MRALAQHSRLPTHHASLFTEPPDKTHAWWLSRSQAATFTRRRIALTDACARAMGAIGSATPVVVEFNGKSFTGASVIASDGGYALDLGDALAQEMAEVLDEDDRLDVAVVEGRCQPALAIEPSVGAAV